MLRAGEKSTHHAKPSSSPAQPWSVMSTVLPRFLQTPACSRNLRSQVPRQAPMRNAAMRRARFPVPCPAPAGPRQSCRQRSCHQLCSEPCAPCPQCLRHRRCRRVAPSVRHLHRVNACRRLGAGSARRLTGFRGVEHPASQAGKLDSSPSSTRSSNTSTSDQNGPKPRRGRYLRACARERYGTPPTTPRENPGTFPSSSSSRAGRVQKTNSETCPH